MAAVMEGRGVRAPADRLAPWRYAWARPVARISRELSGDGRTTARCPIHDDRSPSLSLGTGTDGSPLVHCFAGCDGRDVLAELERLGHVERAAVDCGERRARRREHVPVATVGLSRDDPPEYDDEARRYWSEGKPIEGTPGEVYLRARGLDPDKMLSHPPGWPETLRWHRGLRAILVAVNHWHTSLVAAVHRIYLHADGSPVIGNDGKKRKCRFRRKPAGYSEAKPARVPG